MLAWLTCRVRCQECQNQSTEHKHSVMSINLTGAMSDPLIANFVVAVINAAILAATEEGWPAQEEQLAQQVRDRSASLQFPSLYNLVLF